MNTELLEALTAANVTPLIQKRIDPLLLEYQRRYAPFVAAVPTKQWNSTDYYFNKRTVRPSGGFVTDGGARSVATSTYTQKNYTIKLLQTVGSVTGYAQVVSADLIGDLRRTEIDGAITSLTWDVECAMIWGNSAATTGGTAPQFDGLDTLVSNWSAGSGENAFVNAYDFNATFALKDLDVVIDLVEQNAAMPIDNTDWMFVVSQRLNSKIAQLQTANQRYVDKVEVGVGLNVPTYRGIPIVKSSMLSPRSNAMGSITTATATTGGTLAAATYYYQVTAVIARYGETAACAEVSQTTTGSTSTVTLTVAAPSNMPDSAAPILYKVYRATSTGAETLVGIVDAFDTTGTATTSIIDTGSNLLTNSSGNTGPSAYSGANAGAKPRSADYEDFYLIPRNPDFLLRPFTRDMTFLPLAATTSAPDTLPFALVTDTTLAVRGPKYVGRGSRVSAILS